ncbi:hypothetical protein GW796_10000 [archaeon]|nr:hypothetical protein [archaeon]
MLSLADIATQLNICKTLAIALPRFYKKTGISAQLSFTYNSEQNIEISLGFLPKEPNEEEYSILIEDIVDSEKLLVNEYVINNAQNYETIGQLLFKHREDTNQIISRHRKEAL